MKLWESKRVSQQSVDKAIVNCIIHCLYPLIVVEQEGFKNLVNPLQPSVVVMSRGTVKNKVESLQIHYAALACQHLKGSHSFSVLASALD